MPGVSSKSYLLPSFIILADKEDMHKISDEFKFRPDLTTDYGVTALERLKNFQ